MNRLVTSALSVAAFAVGPVWAQPQGNPAGMTPGATQSGPGMPVPNQPNVPDRNFARAAAIGGMSEVDLGRLDPSKATEQELAGERVFMGKGRCAGCHVPQIAFMDDQMHDLRLERFYRPGQNVNGLVMLPDGPIKTFTLRGIKDSPPYLHDGRLLTLADCVEFFNLVLGLKLTEDEKQSLVAYMLAL